MHDAESPLPPLPMAVLRRLQWLQRETRRILRECNYPGTEELDALRALESIRASFIEELNIRLGFYESAPGFEWEWITQILTEAAWSILGQFPQNRFVTQDEGGKPVYESNSQFLGELVRTGREHVFRWRLRNETLPTGELESKTGEQRKRERLPSSVTSAAAARKVENYLAASELTQTQFAIRAGTTEKTIRKFRQTGQIRRSLLHGIATAMGTTTEELIK